METEANNNSCGIVQKVRHMIFAALLVCGLIPQYAAAFSLNVAGADGVAITDYRWLVEEDVTYAPVPGVPAQPNASYSLGMHKSYMPVVAAGSSADLSALSALDASKRYYVSVLPNSASSDPGHTIGGAQVAVGQSNVNVVVNKLPLPTAQISAFVFLDNRPLNNQADLPEEAGIPNMTLKLMEAGGTFGQSGGEVTKDAFGNPLGTTYNPDNSVLALGTGVIKTDANGVAVIKNLVQGKYTIFASPPAGSDLQQTTTIEGTKGDDAWVKAGEPAYFQEFGPPGHHVSIGFTHRVNAIPVPAAGVNRSNITGRIVNLHNVRPPEVAFYDGHPLPNCWVALNSTPVVGGQVLYAQPCNADSTFTIPGVPAGIYKLAVWDEALDQIFASFDVTVPNTGAEVALLDVPVFRWFAELEGSVFYDANANGFRDPGEIGMPDQAINLRFRDGSIYQATATKADGSYELPEVFPFFNWLVAEVDFARFKATGATIAVDNGGPVDPSDPWSFGKLTPQPQAENGNLPYRTETGLVLLQGMQGFMSMTNHIDWGKQVYPQGQNGGISGIVHYGITRAENDPRYATAENWEPGIPRVTVNLYQDFDADGIPDGAAIGSVTTDSWDDNLPTGCQGDNKLAALGVAADQCFDGLRNMNQVRPALFDGGYAFGGATGLPPGTYIVEAIAPPGYLHQGNGDQNVAFGDTYAPAPLLLPPPCVGDAKAVPQYLTLFPNLQEPNPAYTGPGQTWRQCDRKQVRVAQGANAAADFHMYTEVPVAAHAVGLVLDNLANAWDPNTPSFGEKYAPPYLPISFRDFSGREISRVYADQYGAYNALLPSSYTVNPPFPSGVSPNMLTACMNSPTMPDPAHPGNFMLDPHFNRNYSQFCYTFQYLPGKTTYLDTPVVRISAFAALEKLPLDCEYTDGTPAIYSVSGKNGAIDVGPWVSASTLSNPNPDRSLTIVAMGNVEVNNPAYDGSNAKTIMRDFGFGEFVPGISTARLVNPGNNATVATLTVAPGNWGPGSITASVPGNVSGAYELVITRGNGKSTVSSVTVTAGGPAPITVAAGQSIQAAIDAAPAGSLITVAPGQYDQLPIMYKKLRLQGWGPGSTIINAAKFPAEKLHNWRLKLNSLLAGNQFTLLPGQTPGPLDPMGNEPVLFNTVEGAGITVLGSRNGINWSNNTANNHARIDGFTVTGADASGGIFVNGHANWLEISNNRISSNNGFSGGGIRIGNMDLISGDSYTDNQNDNVSIHHNQVTQNGSEGISGGGGGIALYNGANNYAVRRNLVCGNFSTGNGGGIAHFGYSNNGVIDHNTIVFNETFNQGLNASGGGIYIGGLPAIGGGLSAGTGDVFIDKNLIQGNLAGAGDGGGIRAEFVNGRDVRNNNNGGTTSVSNWNRLDITNNMIVDNIAALAGGGLSLQDVTRSRIVNNTIANNDGIGTAGEAFSPGSPNQSNPQPGGVVARAHSAALLAVFNDNNTPNGIRNTRGAYSTPDRFANNILWHNRSFFWAVDTSVDPATSGLVANPADGGYWDVAVLGTPTARFMLPSYSILSTLTQQGHSYAGFGNLESDPLFQAQYFNTAPATGWTLPEIPPGVGTVPAFNEGGNFISVYYGPLTLDPTAGQALGNYHLMTTGPLSPASQAGNEDVTNGMPRLNSDFDDQIRPSPDDTNPDIGADEINR